MNDMRECPFCNSHDVVCDRDENRPAEPWVVWCKNCGCFGPNELDWSGAVEMWNLRRPYDQLEERRNNLELALNDIIKLVELGDKEND